MDSKRKSLLASPKPGTPKGNKRASMAKTPKPATPAPKAVTPAQSIGSAKKRKSIMEETPGKKKIVKQVEPEEDSEEDIGSDDSDVSEDDSDMGSDEDMGEEASDIDDEEDDDEGNESDSEDDDEPKPQQKKNKQDKKAPQDKKQQNVAPKKDKKKEEKIKLSNPEKTIFVGNLPKEITEDEVKKMFLKYGKISSVRLRSAPIADVRVAKKVAVIKKQFHEERNNINAYVVFDDMESVKKALKENGKEVSGHRIRVDMARATKPDNKLAVFVGNVPFDATEDQLHKVFSSCGQISHIRVIRDKGRNIGKGFAYVNFESTDAVELALLKDGSKTGGRAIRVQRSTEGGGKKKRRSKGFQGEKSSESGPGAKNRKPKPRTMGKPGDKAQSDSPKKVGSPAATFQGQKADQGKVQKKNKKGKMNAKKQAAVETLVKSLPGSAKKTKA